MAVEYAHIPSVAVSKLDAASVALDDEGGTIIVPAAGMKLALSNRYWEIFHTGFDASGSASTALLFMGRGTTMASGPAATDNTSAALRVCKEIPAGGALAARPAPIEGGVGGALTLIPASGTIRVRLSPGRSSVG